MANDSESPIESDVRGTLLPEVTPPIIDEDLFQKANAELDKPKVRTGRPKNEYLLRHHVYCAICGRPLVGHCLNRNIAITSVVPLGRMRMVTSPAVPSTYEPINLRVLYGATQRKLSVIRI